MRLGLHVKLGPTYSQSQPGVHQARHTTKDTGECPQPFPVQRSSRAQKVTPARSTSQHAKRNQAIAHAQPRSDLRLILRQNHETDGWQRDVHATEETDKYCEDNDCCLGLDCHHAQKKDAKNA